MIIVNFATKHYMRGQRRLSESLNGHKQLMLSDYVSLGSPDHSDSPYAFKCYAIESALNYDDIVIWADSSMKLVGDLSKIETIIKEDGYFFQEAGHYVRDWCMPETMKYFGLTKETNYLMFIAGLIGINKNNPLAMQWFKEWKQSEKDGHFKGPWDRHRHDMVCGSILAEKHGMKYQRGGSYIAYIGPGYQPPEPGIVFTCQGII
jgi:hypothetical protein